MRIATWNPDGVGVTKAKKSLLCQEKIDFLESLKADLTVIPDVGSIEPDRLTLALDLRANQFLLDERFSDGKNVAVYVKKGYLQRASFHLRSGYLPFIWHLDFGISVRGVAVYSRWAGKKCGNRGWVKWTWETLETCGSWLDCNHSILAGDLNSSKFFERKEERSKSQYCWVKDNGNKIGFSQINELIKYYNLKICWHKRNNIEFGREDLNEKTQRTYVNEYRPGKFTRTHIDYIFVNNKTFIGSSEIKPRVMDHSAVVADVVFPIGNFQGHVARL